MADELPDADTLRILILTDTHVGFNEKDKVRGKDSLETLEEALQIGKNGRADLILHGGDLFHENKPSRGCLFRTMNLLKQYTMGSGEVAFEVVSDPACFGTGQVNYKDPNLNIECPFFMIHGNHDDPGGESNLCAANILEVGGLCNYFGRHEDLEDIVIRPILLVKGKTRVAIYGLGNIRDERLHRAFQAKKVRFETPVDTEKWFHVMILHQNRHKGNKGAVPSKACIHEEMLPSFLDLVIWGHEHDCQVKPQESLRGEFYVMQPGSSVATSLSPQEAGLKHVALIDVKEGVFRCNPVPLWTVRPLVMRDIVLSETGLLKTDTQAIWNALSGEVDSMIAQGEEEIQRRKKELEAREKFGPKKLEVPELPLVRLRVEHSGFDTISGATFGNQFVGRVANPDEVLLFHRRAGGGAVGSRKVQGLGDILEIEENTMPGDDGVKIQDIIYKYIEGEQNLQVLPEPDLNDAVQSFVHRSEPCAIERFVKQAVESTNQAVLKESRAVGEEEIRVQIQDRAETLRQQRLAAAAAQGSLSGPPTERADSLAKRELDLLEEPRAPAASMAEAIPPTAFQAEEVEAPRRGRGARGGRGSRGGRGRGSKRSQDDFDLAPTPAKQPRIARGDARVAASQASPQASQAPPAPPAQPCAPTAAQASTATVPPAAATPFLPRRAGAVPDAAESFLAPSQHMSQAQLQPPPKRQWALKKGS